jgi:hypothetical protein
MYLSCSADRAGLRLDLPGEAQVYIGVHVQKSSAHYSLFWDSRTFFAHGFTPHSSLDLSTTLIAIEHETENRGSPCLGDVRRTDMIGDDFPTVAMGERLECFTDGHRGIPQSLRVGGLLLERPG